MKFNNLAALASRGLCLAGTATVLIAVPLSTALWAQSPPPVQGTVALEGTMKTFYRAANVVVEGLREGATVVVHYTPAPAEKVTIYYTDDHGEKVVHFVKKIA